MGPSTATSMTRTPPSSTSTSRISPGPGNGSRRTSSWRRPGRRGSSGESSISPTSRSGPQPYRYPMTAAEFHDRTWLPANRAESHRDHGMNRPGRSGLEAGAMNQITPTPANHDRPRPRIPEAGAGREVTGRRRPLLTAAVGRRPAIRVGGWSAGHPRVVVIGGGFAGLRAVRELRRAGVEVTLLDRRNFHLLQPLLCQVASGELSPGEIAYPLRGIFA